MRTDDALAHRTFTLKCFVGGCAYHGTLLTPNVAETTAQQDRDKSSALAWNLVK